MRLEATPRVELGNRGFADLGLTTWLCRQRKLSLSAFRRPNTKMATRMGLEPTISAVTGRHSKPTELPGHNYIVTTFIIIQIEHILVNAKANRVPVVFLPLLYFHVPLSKDMTASSMEPAMQRALSDIV